MEFDENLAKILKIQDEINKQNSTIKETVKLIDELWEKQSTLEGRWILNSVKETIISQMKTIEGLTKNELKRISEKKKRKMRKEKV